MALGGAMEYSFPPLKGAMKMRRLLAKAVDRFPVEDIHGSVSFLKGLSGFGGATLFGESQSWGTWHPPSGGTGW